jgi:GTP-binding protein HflX
MAVLVRVVLPDQSFDSEHPFDELEGLAKTAGANVVGNLLQRREIPNNATYIGSGKVEELAHLVEHHDADMVIFDNDLSPAQTRNLEQATKVKVLDRTELILDIFANNAQTHESRLAVELAQLEYSLPRLKRMWTHLSRIKAGVGMRGPGEKQLEVDRRLEQRKERMVAARHDSMTVSLVGYTNAGKSTLMNRLTDAGVMAQDKLFATLDTRTRRWQLPNWGPVLLSDTVGFIRDLPHSLVASFKATLEEARQADLLLHVADASNPAVLDQIASVYTVLEEIGIEAKDTLLVLNKIDSASSPAVVNALLSRYPNAVPISAAKGTGLEAFAQAVSDALSRSFIDVDIEAGVDNGRLMAFLAAHGEVLSQRFAETKVFIHCRIPPRHLGRIHDSSVIIRRHGEAVEPPVESLDAASLPLEDVA